MKKLFVYALAGLLVSSPAFGQSEERDAAKLAELEARLKKLEAELRRSQDLLQNEYTKRAEEFRKRAEEGRARAEEAMKAAKERLAERLGKGEQAKKEVYFGVQTEGVPEILASHIGNANGVVVLQVLEKSPAEKAGVKKHDVIVMFNGVAVKSPEQFKELVTKEKPGNKARIVVLRHAKDKKELSATLAEREAQRLAVLGGMGPDGMKWDHKMPTTFGWTMSPEVIAKGQTVFKGPINPETFAYRFGDAVKNSVSVNVTVKDGKLTIKADTVKDGKKESKTIEGTVEEVKKKINELPESVRESVRHSLENMKMGENGGQIRIEVRSDESKASTGDKAKQRIKIGKASVGMNAPMEMEIELLDPTKAIHDATQGIKVLLHKDSQGLDPTKLEGLPQEIRVKVQAAIEEARAKAKAGEKAIIIQKLDSQ